MKQLFFLAGLPRTGSTLLTSILYQNPLIHTEGISGLSETMWVMKNSLENNKNIFASGRQSSVGHIMKNLPELYYQNVEREVVVDKNFLWTLNGNIEMIEKYINPNPKFVIVERPVKDIVASFLKLMEKNGANGTYYDEYVKNSTGTLEERREKAILAKGGALDTQLFSLLQTKKLPDQSMFHYVSYDNLVTRTEEVLNGIYDFWEIPRFKHDFENVINHKQEDDRVWGLNGMHDIRPLVKKI